MKQFYLDHSLVGPVYAPDTDLSNRSPSEIESDIEERRAAIDQRLDALTEQTNPINAVGGLLNVDVNDPEQAVRKLLSDAKDNPVPVLLIGAGLLSYWFKKEASSSSPHAHSYDIAPHHLQNKEEIMTKSNIPPTVRPTIANEAPKNSNQAAAEKVASTANKTINSARDQVNDTTSQVADAVSSAKLTAKNASQDAAEAVTNAAKSAKDKIEYTAQATTDAAKEKAEQVSNEARRAYSQGRDRVEEIVETLPREAREVVAVGSEWVRRNPVSSVLIGVAAGAVLGSILSVRKSEPVYRREVRRYTDDNYFDDRRS